MKCLLLANCILALANLCLASDKPIAVLFPAPGGVIPQAELLARSDARYQAVVNCAGAKDAVNAQAACSSITTPFFLNLAGSPNGARSFEIVNRCLLVKPSGKTDIGPITFPTVDTVGCPDNADYITVAHLVACYGKVGSLSYDPGAYCRLATVCFEPTPVQGKCLKDYPAEEVRIAFNGTPPTPAPSPSSGPCASTNSCLNSATQCLFNSPTFQCPAGGPLVTGTSDCACPGKFVYTQPPCPGFPCNF